MISTLYFIIAAGLVAILYGFIVGRQILAASPGNKKMQDIAGATRSVAPRRTDQSSRRRQRGVVRAASG